jgi:hypothetical protein
MHVIDEIVLQHPIPFELCEALNLATLPFATRLDARVVFNINPHLPQLGHNRSLTKHSPHERRGNRSRDNDQQQCAQ